MKALWYNIQIIKKVCKVLILFPVLYSEGTFRTRKGGITWKITRL